MTDDELPPILAGKRYDLPSAFTPMSFLLRHIARYAALAAFSLTQGSEASFCAA